MAFISEEELASIRASIKRYRSGRFHIRMILHRVDWRGVTYDELKQATLLDDASLKAELDHWMVSHCPGCNFYFWSRATKPVLPKGQCHLACCCPLGKPLPNWNQAFRDNPDRPQGVELRKIPLI